MEVKYNLEIIIKDGEAMKDVKIDAKEMNKFVDWAKAEETCNATIVRDMDTWPGHAPHRVKEKGKIVKAVGNLDMYRGDILEAENQPIQAKAKASQATEAKVKEEDQ